MGNPGATHRPQPSAPPHGNTLQPLTRQRPVAVSPGVHRGAVAPLSASAGMPNPAPPPAPPPPRAPPPRPLTSPLRVPPAPAGGVGGGGRAPHRPSPPQDIIS